MAIQPPTGRKSDDRIETTPPPDLAPLADDRVDSEFDWRRAAGILIQAKRRIIFWSLSIFFLGLLICIFLPPTFKSDGLIQIQLDKTSQRPANVSGDQSISYDIAGSSMATDGEIQILQSRMVLTEVIKKLNLLVSAQPNTFPIIGNAVYRFNKDAETPVGAPAYLRRFAWGAEHIDVPLFEVPAALKNKKFLLRAMGENYELFGPDDEVILKGRIGQLSTRRGIQILVDDLRAAPGTTFQLKNLSLEKALDDLNDHLKAEEKVKESGVISISFKGKDPALVALVLSTIQDVYVRTNTEWKSGRAEDLRNALEAQLPRLREQVNTAQQNLNAYQRLHGSVDVTGETQLLLQKGGELQTARLTLLQEREEAAQRFTGNHPMLTGIDEKVQSIDRELSKLKSQAATLPTTQQELLNRTRDLEIANQLYTAMLNTIQQQKVVEAGSLGSSRGNVRIVDTAIVAEKPSFPKPILVIPVSVLLGAMIGAGLAFLKAFAKNPIYYEKEVEQKLGLRVFGRVPSSRAQTKLSRLQRRSTENSRLLATAVGDDRSVESLRSVRSVLRATSGASRNNLVVIAGPGAGTGRSFVAANLAALFALSGKRTLLIDADLSKGCLHEVMEKNSSPGLSDYLTEVVPPGAILQPGKVERLTFVSRGTIRANNADLMREDLLTKLFSLLGARYDHIIVDTPDSARSSIASSIARHAASTVVIVRSGEHSLREVEDCAASLVNAGASVKGVLFNAI